MPYLPHKTCKHPGCMCLAVKDGYCGKHKPPEVVQTGKQFHGLYGRRWQRESKDFLAAHPWCAECEKQGEFTVATVVDHKQPHKGNVKLFWDKNNWQGLCEHCHNVKTAREDGGFGHRKAGSGATPPGQKSFGHNSGDR